MEDVGHWVMRCEACGAQHVPLEDCMDGTVHQLSVPMQDPAASQLSVAYTNYQLYWKLFHVCGMHACICKTLNF